MGIQVASDAIEMNEIYDGGRGVMSCEKVQEVLRSPSVSWKVKGKDPTKGVLGSMVRPIREKAAMPGLRETKKRRTCQEAVNRLKSSGENNKN